MALLFSRNPKIGPMLSSGEWLGMRESVSSPALLKMALLFSRNPKMRPMLSSGEWLGMREDEENAALIATGADVSCNKITILGTYRR
jgi:hypothetical protein